MGSRIAGDSFFFLSNPRFSILFVRIFCHFKLHVLCLIPLLPLWIDPPKDNGGAAINKYVVEMAEGSNGKKNYYKIADVYQSVCLYSL